jgi:hypothetical protein
MKCEVCGKEIKGRFHKVYLKEINSYAFVCHNCLEVENVVRYKIKDGITNNIKGCYTPNLKFIQYEDEQYFKNIKEYIYTLNERKDYLERQIKNTTKEVLLFLLQSELKDIKLELIHLQEESDV